MVKIHSTAAVRESKKAGRLEECRLEAGIQKFKWC